MSDNTVLNPGSGGDTIRDLARQGGSVKTPVYQLDIGGSSSNAENLVTNAMPVTGYGSTGSDYSANQPTLPDVNANFGATGPYANYLLIATVAAAARNLIDVENTSGAQIVIIRDDGTASNGSAPANASIFALAGGGVAGAQGASWTSTTFKGRIQVYALSSSAQVAIMVD